MTHDVDKLLRDALRGVQAPPAGADDRERVRAAVMAAAAAKQPAPEDPRPLGTPRRRRLLSLAAAALVITAVVVGLLLFGAPGSNGPEPVSAEQALQRALQALSKGRTFQADVTVRATGWADVATSRRLTVDRFRLAMRADGSYRLRLTGGDRAGWWPRVGPLAKLTVYDARRGVLVERSQQHRWTEHTNAPPGPPERWAGLITQYDFSATARALQIAGAARLESATLEGRPVWVIICSQASRVPSPVSNDYGVSFRITIDRQSHLPLRYQTVDVGFLIIDVRYSNVRVNEPLPDAVFRAHPPAGTSMKRVDDGFARVSAGDAAALSGYLPVFPASVPRGYGSRQVVVARRATTANGVTEAARIFSLRYTRGFDALTVTTRRPADPYAYLDDPFEPTAYWTSAHRSERQITSGAFRGASAFVVVAPQVTTPHLWAMKDGVMLTVAGSATEAELLAVANSLRVPGR